MREHIDERAAKIERDKITDGYTKNIIGVMPDDWHTYTIADCLERVGRPVDVQKDVLYTQIGIRSHGKGIFYKEPVSGRSLGNKAVYWIEPNCFVLNIVFAWEQAIGKTSADEIGMIGSHRFPMYRQKNGLVDIDYLIMYLLTKKGTELLEAASPGGAGRNRTLGQDRFMKSKITLPPLPEQRKIAAILSTQDKLIELKSSLLDEKLRQKKYLAQILLSGKKRMKGFEDEWRLVRLAEVLKERTEANDKQIYRVHSVAVQKGVIDQIEHLGRSFAADDTSHYGVAHNGDIIYTKSPTGDFPYGIVKQSHISEPVAVSPLYGIYTPQTKELGYMLHVFFGYAINARNYLTPLIQKGAKNTINISNTRFLEGTLYLTQNADEQQALADIFSTADREIELLRQELELEKQKKKALMQLLLTGKVRVKTDE